MKINFHFNLFKGILTALVVLLFSTVGWSQGASIQLVDVFIPDTVTLNSTIIISGKFKNSGTTHYNGSLGLHLQVKDDVFSGPGTYYSSDIQSVGNYSLQPGQEASFTATVHVVQSLFKIQKDVVIIFPKIGNEISPSNPSYQKEVELN